MARLNNNEFSEHLNHLSNTGELYEDDMVFNNTRSNSYDRQPQREFVDYSSKESEKYRKLDEDIQRKKNKKHVNKEYNKVNKLMVALVVILFLTFVAVGSIIVFMPNEEDLPKQIQEAVTIEAGAPVPVGASSYFTGSVKDIIVTGPLVDDTDIYDYDDSKEVVTSKDKGYLDAGTYTLNYITKGTFFNKSQVFTQTFNIVDNISPEIVFAPEKIKISKDGSLPDLKELVEVNDLSEYTVYLDTDTINFEKKGFYDSNIIVEDKSNNVSKSPVIVAVPNLSEDAIANIVNLTHRDEPVIPDEVLQKIYNGTEKNN